MEAFMKLNQRGLLVVLSGPSGVGKATVRKALFKSPDHKFTYSVSMTTRKPREGEVEGQDYFFVSEEEFLQRIKDGRFLEYAKFVGNYYGTPIEQVQQMMDQGDEVVLEIEVEGAMQVKAKMPDAVFIFIAPPSWKALESRLINRGTETSDIIMQRLQKARSELNLASAYDYIVVNDEVENAVDRIMAIIRAEHAKCRRALERYYQLMEE
jgi:guanylate kinase